MSWNNLPLERFPNAWYERTKPHASCSSSVLVSVPPFVTLETRGDLVTRQSDALRSKRTHDGYMSLGLLEGRVVELVELAGERSPWGKAQPVDVLHEAEPAMHEVHVIEYCLDYEKLDGRAIGRLRGSTYSAVIVGPIPHSVAGKGDASSASQRMQDHPELYRPVIEACGSSGLKITNNSFEAALYELEGLLAA